MVSDMLLIYLFCYLFIYCLFALFTCIFLISYSTTSHLFDGKIIYSSRFKWIDVDPLATRNINHFVD